MVACVVHAVADQETFEPCEGGKIGAQFGVLPRAIHHHGGGDRLGALFAQQIACFGERAAAIQNAVEHQNIAAAHPRAGADHHRDVARAFAVARIGAQPEKFRRKIKPAARQRA